MRNLKNINHWIAELRDIAYKSDLFDLDDNKNYPMTKEAKKQIFSKERFEEDFKQGYTPQDAFENEMDFWKEAENESCRI
jgi:hypothetical protein